MLRWIVLISALSAPLTTTAQSFSKTDVDRIMTSYTLGAHDEIEQLKFELLNSDNGAKLLQGVPENSFTRAFVQFGQLTNSPSVATLTQIAKASEFSSLSAWALTHDRIIGLANSALLAGWGIHIDDDRYSDPNYPDTLAFVRDRSLPWAKRAVTIDELEVWCQTLCVNTDTFEEDKQVLAPRYLEVVKAMFPDEATQ